MTHLSVASAHAVTSTRNPGSLAPSAGQPHSIIGSGLEGHMEQKALVIQPGPGSSVKSLVRTSLLFCRFTPVCNYSYSSDYMFFVLFMELPASSESRNYCLCLVSGAHWWGQVMFVERRITQNIWHSKDQTKDHSMWMEWGIVLRWSTCLAQARPGSISSTARK